MEEAPMLQQKPPHVVLVPFMAQGHLIPMADIARLLAARGATVTLATTPLNAARIRPAIDLMPTTSVRLLELPFSCSDAGLPDGCESADRITSKDQFIPFFKSARLLYNPLLHHLKTLSPAPTCLVADMFHPWTAELARELHIRRFVFHGSSCLYILCAHLIQKSGICQTLENDLDPFLVPGLPNHHMIVVDKATSPRFFPLAEMEELARDAAEAETTADGILLNSFVDLESEFIDLYEESVSTKVWPIGPLSLCNKDPPATREGNPNPNPNHAVLGWLDDMEDGSVVYFSFGSLVMSSFKQVVEIGLGLEATGRPFVWVVKEAEKSSEVEKWVSEMEGRTKGRGVIIRGWAPQVAILNHAAVGGFVTHCGWNSTLEAVAAGVPVVTWPHFADQFLNEKLVVEELGVGVKVGVAAPVYLLEGAMDGVAVWREDVKIAIGRVMDGGEEGRERREKARELGVKARMAMEEGGSSYESLTKLMEFLLRPLMEVKAA